MVITELAVLKFLHIIAMVYWLGGEWGIFNTSRHVIDRNLSMEERRRHMNTAYLIDIPARTGIILLFPVGFHMGHIWGLHDFGGSYLVAMWVLVLAWLGLCWAAFIKRETDTGIRLTKMDEAVRYVLIPLFIITAITSLMGYGPYEAGPMQKWFAIKVGLFGGLLIIGLVLRFIMREWTMLFRVLAEGPNVEAENKLEKSLRLGRGLAYVYWVGIAAVAFFGATKFM
ncbi:MAG: hypothetical protein F4W90_05315 [Gammaproteobacteria bacterium]|nr:hypothetical protein [Gammaproteobacteria bacterium]